jgi:hypothetical protein
VAEVDRYRIAMRDCRAEYGRKDQHPDNRAARGQRRVIR